MTYSPKQLLLISTIALAIPYPIGISMAYLPAFGQNESLFQMGDIVFTISIVIGAMIATATTIIALARWNQG